MSSVNEDNEIPNEEVTNSKNKKPKLPANVGTLPPGEDPFKNYLINDWHFLEDVDQRSICPKCNKSRKYFCYTCYVPVAELTGKIPVVKLPIKVDIIKHSREIDGKSTASHAAVLAPEDVSIYTYPCIPDYDQKSGKVILVFPSKTAMSVAEYVNKLSSWEKSIPPDAKRPKFDAKHPIERVVLIDSTWNQCRGIYKDSRLKGLPCVVLQDRISQFWRHQEGSPRWYLATVEAVHQVLVELEATQQSGVSHDFDNLLFFFRFMYDKIHTLYEPESLRAYKRPLDL